MPSTRSKVPSRSKLVTSKSTDENLLANLKFDDRHKENELTKTSKTIHH